MEYKYTNDFLKNISRKIIETPITKSKIETSNSNNNVLTKEKQLKEMLEMIFNSYVEQLTTDHDSLKIVETVSKVYKIFKNLNWGN